MNTATQEHEQHEAVACVDCGGRVPDDLAALGYRQCPPCIDAEVPEERCCRWCDALGHDYEDDAYCPSGKPVGWFNPSDPRDLVDPYHGEEAF